MPDRQVLGLFEGVGIELEYMIVDRARLDVLPICDRLLSKQAGQITGDVEFEDISWSNELALHVVELKTSGPVASLDGLDDHFGQHLSRINDLLGPLNARLMPTAVHPWMDPTRQTQLWPHDCGPIYQAFQRIFDCRSHGWSNLQSVHINLPFADDEQFGRLHAAIRLLLPIVPALAASSPIIEGRVTGLMDNRLAAYRHHCARIPSMQRRLIPEPVYTRRGYERDVLEPIYRDLTPYDPEGILRYEWANARGAIARFERNTIEIRLLDVQECPAADLAIASAVIAALRLLIDQVWMSLTDQQNFPTEQLANLLDQTIQDADRTLITDEAYLRAFGWRGAMPCTTGALWRHILDTAQAQYPDVLACYQQPLQTILQQGPLAHRILAELGSSPNPERLLAIYSRLCDCLERGVMFGDTTTEAIAHR